MSTNNSGASPFLTRLKSRAGRSTTSQRATGVPDTAARRNDVRDVDEDFIGNAEFALARAIGEVTRAAFGKEREVRMVDAIRASEGFVPDLSLVAVNDGEIIGHAMLS